MRLARFEYTQVQGDKPLPVYVNPAYVAAVKTYDDTFTSIWMNGIQYPILVNQSVGWVKEALEQAQE